MDMIPLQPGHHPATSIGDCRLCAEMRAPVASSESATTQSRYFVPLVVVAMLGFVLFVVDRGIAGSLAGGVAVGIAICVVFVWRGRRNLIRSAHEAHAAELEALTEEADGRVEAVVKQFEWAVNDFATLRRKLEQTEAAVQTLTERGREREHQNENLVRQISLLRERLAEIAMAASMPQSGNELPSPALPSQVQFSWGLHLDGPRARLELQTAATSDSPTRLRVIDPDGQIVAVSGMAVVSLDGNLEFQLEPPIDLIADLDEGREIEYAIEALVGQDWKPVDLRDTGRRTRSVVDMHGRISRVPEASDASRRPAPVDGPRSALAEGRRSALN
jgi:hypothetical protein